MKVAICLFGIPRLIDVTISQYAEFLKDYDVFAHTWSEDLPVQMKILNLKSCLFEPLHDTRTHAFVGVLPPKDLQEIQKLRIKEGVQGFHKKWTIPGWESVPVNTVSMWHSMAKSITLALGHECLTGEKYDRIVLLRTDLVFDKDFSFEKTFVGDIHQFLMPSFHPGSRIDEWLPDHIISMSRDAARLMTTLLQSSYHYYFAAEVPEIPEIMLGFHMLQNGMKVEKSGMYYREAYKFFRDDGSI